MKQIKNILFLVVLIATTLFATSCKSLKTGDTSEVSENKKEVKKIASTIIDVSLDYSAYRFSKELKPVTVALKTDTIQQITFIDKFGFVKLNKRETADSLFLEFTPVWLTIRDSLHSEIIKHTKIQSEFVQDVVGIALNYAMIEASEKVGAVAIKIPRYSFEERTYATRNRIIIVRICPDDKCLILSIDPFAFSDFLKNLSKERILKI